MKHTTFKMISRGAARVAAAISATAALCACAPSTPTVKFDDVKPWHDTGASYERLEYSTAIYDASKGGEADKRVKIADGSLAFTLTEHTRAEGTIYYNELEMEFSVTYNDSAPEPDRGKTDRISSVTEFMTDSLVASRMTKTVEIAKREDTANRSYRLEADYFGTHKATLTHTGGESETTETMNIGKDTYYDNETMFFLARATAIGAKTSTTFRMTNLYQSFDVGKFTNYTMIASGDSDLQSLDIGDFVKDFGAEAVTADDGTTSYPLSCYRVNIMINADKHGPPYVVHYTEKPFKSDDKEHKKIPVKISYSQYAGSKLSVVTEYTLVGCSFDKP